MFGRRDWTANGWKLVMLYNDLGFMTRQYHPDKAYRAKYNYIFKNIFEPNLFGVEIFDLKRLWGPFPLGQTLGTPETRRSYYYITASEVGQLMGGN